MSRFCRRIAILLGLLLLLGTALAQGQRMFADGGDLRGAVLAQRVALGLKKTSGEEELSWKSRVSRTDWFDGGSEVLKKGKYGYIYDIETGIVVHIKRTGGTGHADCEPASRSDTAKLKKISGGKFTSEAHPVILYAGGRFVTCGISTKPHGKQTICNNGYDGQFCLHMAGSLEHGEEGVNEAQQKAVALAYKWAH